MNRKHYFLAHSLRLILPYTEENNITRKVQTISHMDIDEKVLDKISTRYKKDYTL